MHNSVSFYKYIHSCKDLNQDRSNTVWKWLNCIKNDRELQLPKMWIFALVASNVWGHSFWVCQFFALVSSVAWQHFTLAGSFCLSTQACFVLSVSSWMVMQKWCVTEIFFFDMSLTWWLMAVMKYFSFKKWTTSSWLYILVFDVIFAKNCQWNVLYFLFILKISTISLFYVYYFYPWSDV